MSEDRWFEQAFDAPYLEVYAHRSQEEADRGVQHLLLPHDLDAARILDLACGAGRWLLPLARAGARVVGADLSADLLREAAALRRSQSADFALVRSDMRHVPLATASFDVVLSLFTSFGYFEAIADDHRVLREAHRLLRPNGMLLLDLFNARRVRDTLQPETRRRAGRYDVIERRRIDEERHMVVKDITLQADGVTHRYRERVRLWEQEALLPVLQECGFRTRRCLGDYEGAPFDVLDSPRLIVEAEASEASPGP